MDDIPTIESSTSEPPSTFGAITAEFFRNMWGVSRMLVVMGVVTLAVASIVVPMVLLAPFLVLALPLMQYWYRAGVLAEIKPWQTHASTVASVAATGVVGGVYLSLERPGALEAIGGWSAYLLGACAGLGMLVGVFRATSDMQDGVAASRAMLASAVLLVVGIIARISHIVQQGDGMAEHVSGAVFAGSVAAAIWVLVVIFPRRSVRSIGEHPSTA